LLCCVSRSSLYCNIPSDLSTLCLSCYYFYIVLSLYLYCCYVVVSRSSLYCNIPSDLPTLCLSCYYFYIVLSLYVYCCYVMYLDHHFTVISLQICVLCVCLVITSTMFYLYKLYCCYVVYLDHHFTVIYLQTCVLCVCLVITSTLFYLYTCTVVMLCIQIITLL
jgi:hypothetical protein